MLRIGKNFMITLLLTLMAITTPAVAQTANDLAATWQLVSIDNVNGGKKAPVFGEKPKGLYVFTADGHFMYLLSKTELPKFSSNNRLTGTPEENKAVVQGSIAAFGTYSVNEADKSLTLNFESSTYPNWIGTTQKRLYKLAQNELTLTTPNPSIGAGSNELVFKRIQHQ